jgi:hypothetical protein
MFSLNSGMLQFKKEILSTMNIRRSFTWLACASILFFSLQSAVAQDKIQPELEDVIKDWYTSISNGQLTHFSELLTDDFQLMAFGARFDKKQILQMVKDYSNIDYSLTNVRYETGESIAYISFNVEMKAVYQGKFILGKAMEAYLLKKIDNTWKVNTKVIVMIEDKK